MDMKRQAFTLIELLIVIVIIGILATLAIPQYQNITRKAQAAEAKAELRALSDAIWHYYVESGRMPRDWPDAGYDDSLMPVSKYFTYYYGLQTKTLPSPIPSEFPPYGFVYARFNNYTSFKDSDVMDYFICFSTIPPGKGIPQSSTFTQMDDTWYRYYGYYTKNGNCTLSWSE